MAKFVSVCYRVDKGPKKGGGGGVNALLKFYNEKLNIIKGLQHEFKPKKGAITRLWDKAKVKSGKKSYYLDRFGNNLEKKFDSNTLFLCHEIDSAAELVRRGRKVLLVYHNQFTVTTVKEEFDKLSEEEKKKSEEIEKLAFLGSKAVAFPSEGARDSYLANTVFDEDYKSQVFEKTEIIYNACNEIPKGGKPKCSDEVLKQVKGRKVLLTVSTLFDAKGVDLIPEQLKKIKNFKERFVWILCGSKGECKDLIIRKVKDYGLEDAFIHIDFRMPQEELSFFYEISDFYIMHHRISIFDLATLEAMSFGLIPVLSPVGGNLEVDKEGNVIFMPKVGEDFELSDDNETLKKLKTKNKSVLEGYFSPTAFMERYKEFLEKYY